MIKLLFCLIFITAVYADYDIVIDKSKTVGYLKATRDQEELHKKSPGYVMWKGKRWTLPSARVKGCDDTVR